MRISASIIKQEKSKNIRTYYVSSHEENIAVLNMIKARKESFVKIVYSGEMALDENEYLKDISFYKDAYQDYVYNTGYGIGTSYSDSMSRQTDVITNDIIIKYTSYFNETEEETNFVYNIIRQAIKSNISKLDTDYDKARWAFNWVIENAYYDKTLKNTSPYTALSGNGTICMGYAALYCALLSELGLDCRYISGIVEETFNHAWNILKLNGKWYAVDLTWGDSIYGDKYFLKSIDTLKTNEYGKHESKTYDEYIKSGEVFSESDYDPTIDKESYSVLSPSVYNVEFDVLKCNTLQVGEKYQYLLSNKDNVKLSFNSDNKDVAIVDKNGIIIAVGEGASTITIYNTDLNIARTCKITVNEKQS